MITGLGLLVAITALLLPDGDPAGQPAAARTRPWWLRGVLAAIAPPFVILRC